MDPLEPSSPTTTTPRRTTTMAASLCACRCGTTPRNTSRTRFPSRAAAQRRQEADARRLEHDHLQRRCLRIARDIGLTLGPTAEAWYVDWTAPRPSSGGCVASGDGPAIPRGTKKGHRLYFSDVKETQQFIDPATAGMLIECRSGSSKGTAQQSMVPPSVHPDGDRLQYQEAGEPARVAGADLLRAVKRIAAGVLVQRSMIAGKANNTVGAWAGFLIGNGMDATDCAEFLEIIAEAFGHDAPKVRGFVEYTAQTLREGEAATGEPTLHDLGVDERVTKKVSAWLDVNLIKKRTERLVANLTAQPADFAKAWKATDQWNAEQLIARHGREIRYCNAMKRWLVWSGKHWAVDDGIQIVIRAKDTVQSLYDCISLFPTQTKDDARQIEAFAAFLRSSQSRHRTESMVWMAGREKAVLIEPGALDPDPFLLSCPNGTLNLETGELAPHDPADMITKLFPVEYDANAPRPDRWLAFLAEVFEEAEEGEMSRFLQRLIGYTLTGSVREEKAFILCGTGQNGKSTVVNVCQALFGEFFGELPIRELIKQAYESVPQSIAGLRGKRFVKSVEPDAEQPLSESRIKNLAQNETITARFMNENDFSFMPSHKLMILTNHLPRVRGTDDGIWRRLVVIPFDYTIPNAKKIPDFHKVVLEPELPGIFAWAVRGCLEWQRDGLQLPKAVTEKSSEYRQEQNQAAQFVTERCVRDRNATVRPTELWEKFQAFAADEGVSEVLTKGEFQKALTAMGFQSVKSNGVRLRRGIRLKADGLLD